MSAMKRGEAVTGPRNNGPEHDASSDAETERALEQGDKEKIDQMLDELNVSTTESGKDQTSKPDTEGSNSSSKNLDEQND